MTAADLSHIDTWLFDLDNTLYPAETGLGVEISARITGYVAELTGLERGSAQALQKRYLDEYGLTLRGLMLHHGVDPDAFHAIFDDLALTALPRDEALADAVASLPGRRLIFTNAHEGHVRRVLARLGLADLFHGVFHIGHANYAPKPAPEAFERMTAAFGLRAASTCFFEDRAANLQPAAALGMTTVLVGLGAEANADPFVRHRAPRLAPFLAAARVKEPA
ncbi:MAG: pyrimidine 5'-nucleotidase [Caulobacteraceae bacterium]